MLGTRGSDLALAQTKMVEQALRNAWPDLEVATEIIRTSGDEGARAAPVVDRKAGRKGMFTREIEKELLVRRIDVAVHSAKDLPSERSEELEVRATLARANVQDILITKTSDGLMTIPAGGVIGTGSIRRQRQLGWLRPDLRIADLRGNVPTRLRKLRENEIWSGIILARAGLERLGLEVAGEILSQDDFVPAGGQGIIALQLRRDNQRVQRLVDAVNDGGTRLCLRAEREFLRLLDGDCDSPVGVHANIAGPGMVLQAQVFREKENQPERGRVRSAPGTQDPEALASFLYNSMYGQRQSR